MYLLSLVVSLWGVFLTYTFFKNLIYPPVYDENGEYICSVDRPQDLRQVPRLPPSRKAARRGVSNLENTHEAAKQEWKY